ncbi:peptidylprolyl isomerase [Albidovulum inexpectatum]|uniref:Peptidyl-prolyl cis-trans isomerase n=1 Tax=Albidovulum inexpectatum TaxID=196587 RepID=A0A2S5JIV9_9RHOB|nr:peptidylprolyl isomerase [Albidovulum inexpectatum]PPB81321.1 peptidylprolyl isomerase [Albidovulum inexpectatum]
MSDGRVFMGSILAAAIAGGAAFFLYTKQVNSTVPDTDGPGPNLVIEVAGQANGRVVIDLYADKAPRHAQRLVELARTGAYDNVVFHRVIDGFMAQTGDVQYGKLGGNLELAGTGGSALPDLPLEPSDIPFRRGVVGMARGSDPDSANSQFFIMYGAGDHLNGDYTVVGHVIEGMEVVDAIRKGDFDLNGRVENPDYMVKVTVEE